MKYDITKNKIRKIFNNTQDVENQLVKEKINNENKIKIIDLANKSQYIFKRGYNYASDWTQCTIDESDTTDYYNIYYAWEVNLKLHLDWIPFINWNILHRGNDLTDTIREKISLNSSIQIQDLLLGDHSPTQEKIKNVIMSFGFFIPKLEESIDNPIPNIEVKLLLNIVNPNKYV